MTSMRHVNAAASIIHHDGKVLVVLKEGWDQFCVPVTKIDDESGERGSQAAARDIADVLGSAPPHEPYLLLDGGFPETSLRTGEIAHYEFQVYVCELPALSPEFERAGRWLTVDELLDAVTEDISPTARRLIQTLREAAVEAGRQFPPPTTAPPRSSTASVAIIRREGANGPEWLAQYNQRWSRYFLVGGHEEPGETTSECLLRELHEELQVTAEDVTASEPQLSSFMAWSTGSWQLTDYKITAFPVTLSAAAQQRVTTQPENRWLTAPEIHSERCTDGKLISPTMCRVLQETGDLPTA